VVFLYLGGLGVKKGKNFVDLGRDGRSSPDTQPGGDKKQQKKQPLVHSNY
jgi:hypothetical protein